MCKLEYVLITRNRPEILMQHINAVKDYLKKYDIKYHILDGSDCENQQIKDYIAEKNISNVNYDYLPELELWERGTLGFEQASGEYVCKIGDSQIPLVDKFDKLIDILNEGYDLINLSYRDRKHLVKQEYFDIVDMMKDNAWDMTLYGTVFFKRDSYERVSEKMFQTKEFYYMTYYFDYYKFDKQFKGLYMAFPIICISQQKKGDSWWNVLTTWGKDWSICIDSLSNRYDLYKAQVILDHGKYSSLKLNSLRSYFKQRYSGAIDYKTIKNYKMYIKEITTVPYTIILLISCIPKSIIKTGVHLLRFLKGKKYEN